MHAARRLGASVSTAQQKFESSPLGEVLISALVSMILLVAVVWSSPDSAFRRTAIPPVEPIALASGLDQSWYMFAPDPYRQLETVEVLVTTADGDEHVWTFPHGNVFTQFSWYHWHKLKEQSVKNPGIRADITRWAAGQMVEPAEYPVRIAMILEVETFPLPGVSNPRVTTRTETLFTETMSGPP